MAKEIERKFLVLNDDWMHLVSQKLEIKQAYLSVDPEVVRVRTVTEGPSCKGFLTRKSDKVGITSDEDEGEISYLTAESLMRDRRIGDIIEKTRHIAYFGGFKWEIDLFHGDHEGRVVAEIELPAEDTDFPRPDWLGFEVTHDRQFSNAVMAMSKVNKPRIGFMCGVTYQHELGEDAFGSKIYPDLESLLDATKCTNQCGIVEVEVYLKNWITQQDFTTAGTELAQIEEPGERLEVGYTDEQVAILNAHREGVQEVLTDLKAIALGGSVPGFTKEEVIEALKHTIAKFDN